MVAVMTPPAGKHLETGVRDGICTLTFRRPEAFNALDEEMAVGLVRQLAEAEADDSIRVVIITGSGGAFSAGADLEGQNPVAGFDERTMDGANMIIRSITGLGKPVVAAVNGVAAGVGASICFAADLAVAQRSATFLIAFSRIGLMPDGGASLTVAASVGRARALRMALLAEPITAEEAYEKGLVSHLVDDDDFDESVAKVARRLAAGPPIAFAATKKAINAATLPGLEQVLERERTGQLVLFRTEDAAEGTRAFVQKRRPTFVGR